MTGFEFGAKVLGISVDALVEIYKSTVSVMAGGIAAGKTNAPLGLIHTLGYYDLLHGGAYAAPMNQRPYYLLNPATSPYYAGDLSKGLVQTTWLSWIAQESAGISATQMANEILIDGNVPHVFPKLLSDETYAQIKIYYAQAATTQLFAQASTGVATLVEGFGNALGTSSTEAERKIGSSGGETDFLRQQNRGLMTLIGRLG